ncbi:MAG TPA: polysaccharide biosynthesis/export family protein [Pyrinomonadaceae bacterium]|nr:polysaccharide biosynthesis/export family protein [Pyrinomonadaceae bacterium]
MRAGNRGLIAVFAIVFAGSSAAASFAQTQETVSNKTRQRVVTTPAEEKSANQVSQKPVSTTTPGERLEPDDNSRTPADVPAETQANRQEQISEEAAVVPFYNNFFSTYRLGPEDVISVTVFGQERYSRSGIVIPPSGRIALTLIPDGIFVNGKTVEQVAELIKKRYDEYIIEPQVSVSLDKASSYRYAVIGDVGQPGIRMMTHRMTVTEALNEAGGVLPTGDKSRVVVLRRQPNGNLASIAVNVSKIYKGQLADSTYLVPGDQVVVPGNKLKTFQKIMSFVPILSFARIFTGGFPY